MKGRKHHASGGEVETGRKDYDADLATKNQRYTYQSNVDDEAEERKKGGRVKKHVGHVMGAMAKAHAGRKPRKNGGRTGSNMNPLSSAASGTPAPGRKVQKITE